jgi:iron-sulfur cluster repair protein YtfE (RIC family)
MNVFHEEAHVANECEAQWLTRSIADLIRHLSFHYNTPIYKRLSVIGKSADQIRLRATGGLGRSEHAANAFGVRLSNLVTTLRLVLEAHAWSEGDVLFPAAVAVEVHGLASTRFGQGSLNILLDGIRQEHDLIRELLASLVRTIEEYALVGGVDELEAFVSELEIVSFMIAEQLDLEDRCLWPRVRDLFSQ